MAEEKKFRPYIPWKTFFSVLLQMEEEGLPARIDRSYLHNRSGNDQSYLISTLKSFGLIDEQGEVRPELTRLVHEKDSRPGQIGALLRANYTEAVELAQNATQLQLDEVFRESYGLTGDTMRKAERFFLHAAEYAGIQLSPHFKTTRGTSATPSSSRRSGARRNPRPPRDEQTGSQRNLSGKSQTTDMRQAYFELLRKKAEESPELNADLLDRIERLIGLADGGNHEEE